MPVARLVSLFLGQAVVQSFFVLIKLLGILGIQGIKGQALVRRKFLARLDALRFRESCREGWFFLNSFETTPRRARAVLRIV